MKILNTEYSILNTRKGFTLIELLTVIGIIAVLTGLFTVSYLAVRQRGRDAQRKSSVKQIQSALELFRADNDIYPDTTSFQNIGCNNPFSYDKSSSTFNPSPTTSSTITYMNTIPCDPTTGSAYYYFSATPTTYVIVSCLENTSDKDGRDGTSASTPSWWPATAPTWPPSTLVCPSGVTYYYAVSNP
ncbi:MAG: type II secretion system protein [Candidatus Levyibacteriota bacterium]